MSKFCELRMLPVSELKPAEYNPRKKLKPGDKEYKKIKNSIEEFGFAAPLVVNKDMTIIGGHQRLSVAMDLGYTEVPCAVVDEDKTREKALNIALNKITGEWDEQMLVDLITELKDADYDLDFTGFDAPEVDTLLSAVHDKNVKEDDFDVEAELQKPCFSKTGDIWHLGRHTVICGDSTDSGVFSALLGNTKVNLVCTDAPYFVDLESASGKIKNDDLDDKSAYEFLMKVFTNFKNAMAIDASIYEFYATRKSRIFYDAFEDAGFKVGAGLMWKKPHAPLMRTDWKFSGEPVIYGWRKDGKHIWYGDQKQTNIFEFDSIRNSKKDGFGHPSSKPVPLIAYLIKQSTMSNGLVLDGFLGSGSTLIACDQLERICYGVEIEEKFVDVSVNRYIASKGGRYEDVYVIRDGQKLKYDEVAIKDEDNS